MSRDQTAATEPGPASSDVAAAEGAVGRFRLLERLGDGEVYAAHDPELGRTVAVKLLRSPGAAREALLRREAKVMAGLTHPNLIRVYDVGVDDGRLYVAMELVDGESLREWLREPRRWREVLDRFLSAGRGLAAAHRAGVVHRGLTLDSVLVDQNGRVLVSDFGPVEQLDRELDAPTDQLGFCAALFEALYRRPPASMASK